MRHPPVMRMRSFGLDQWPTGPNSHSHTFNTQDSSGQGLQLGQDEGLEPAAPLPNRVLYAHHVVVYNPIVTWLNHSSVLYDPCLKLSHVCRKTI